MNASLDLMPPFVEYLDVSRDPKAREASELPAELLAKPAELGFTELGWIAYVVTGDDGRSGFVSHVSMGGSTALSLQTIHGAGRTFSATTLLEDGTVLSTESGAFTASTRAVIQRLSADPALRYLHAWSDAADVGTFLAEHEARVAALVSPDNPAVPIDLRAYVAVRRRWREIVDAYDAARLAWSSRIGRGLLAVGLISMGLAVWKIYPAVAAPYGTIAALVACSISIVAIGATADSLGAALRPVVDEVLLRRHEVSAVSRPRPARELLRAGDEPKTASIPPEILAGQAARPRAIVVADTDPERLLRADLLASVGTSALFPLVGFALSVRWDVVGVIVAIGLGLCVDAVMVLATGMGLRDRVRRELVPELVSAERDAAPDDTGSVAPVLALLRGLAGAVVLAIAYGLGRSGVSFDPTPPATLGLVWGGAALAIAIRAWVKTTAHHARVVLAATRRRT